jgi:hypothetical protein
MDGKAQSVRGKAPSTSGDALGSGGKALIIRGQTRIIGGNALIFSGNALIIPARPSLSATPLRPLVGKPCFQREALISARRTSHYRRERACK